MCVLYSGLISLASVIHKLPVSRNSTGQFISIAFEIKDNPNPKKPTVDHGGIFYRLFPLDCWSTYVFKYPFNFVIKRSTRIITRTWLQII